MPVNALEDFERHSSGTLDAISIPAGGGQGELKRRRWFLLILKKEFPLNGFPVTVVFRARVKPAGTRSL